MSIKNKVRIIDRVNAIVFDFKSKYPAHLDAHDELEKLNKTLNQLEAYLTNLDQLKPNYNTNAINDHVVKINLHLDILTNELKKNDYQKLKRGINTIKTVLKFHPTKHSYFEFVVIWIMEFFYFI